MLNTAAIQGRLTADPELRHTNSDIAVTSICVAVDRDYCKKGEDRQADFINVVAWRNTAEFISKYFHKGDMIIIQGSIQTRKWQDDNGNNRYATEVVAVSANFCGSKKDSTNIDVSPNEPSRPATPVSTGNNTDFVEIDGDDDLPF